jgi:hypothetical protein
MDAREVDSNAVPFSGPLPRSNLNRKLSLPLVLQTEALHAILLVLHVDPFCRLAFFFHPNEDSLCSLLTDCLNAKSMRSTWCTRC